MKVCICSDSHGHAAGLQAMLDLEQPQVLLFLGDGERDFHRIDLPRGTVLYAVSGNCDMMSLEPPWRLVELENVRIFMTHGHFYGVKSDTDRLIERAKEEQVQLVVHGHTHLKNLQELDDITLLCPGSMGHKTEDYVVMEIKNGEITISFKQL